ncbi:hypothetical protein GQ53DRAFT_816322 [Thozetella sp. PMI_491]|nr:hypothetical protein GQ53DRAFT_816322 [Thozetella sp. PMI_491]
MCASPEVSLHAGGTLKVSGGCFDSLQLDDLRDTDWEPTMSRLSPRPRSCSRASLAPSETTYHSFLDNNDVQEPPAASAPYVTAPAKALREIQTPARPEDVDPPVCLEMRRQDSGYESLTPRRSYSSRHRSSSITTSSHRPKTRPSIRRAAMSGPVSAIPKCRGDGLFRRAPTSQSLHSHQPGTFFHFPNFASSQPEADETELVVDSRLAQDLNSSRPYTAAAAYQAQQEPLRSETPTFPHPPQTTHYWTSDRTRRLEYAAIDAASKGVRGWVMRYVIPDCFVPKDRRRMRFDDDRGSVVRYRIDLEEEEKDDCGAGKRRNSWWFSR